MYSPDFTSFNKNQIVLSSDRVTLHSKTDSIFLFGSEAVSLSSKKTINLDAIDRVLVFAPRIELGDNATHPLVLGDNLNDALIYLMGQIMKASNVLHGVSGGEFDVKQSMEKVKSAGQILHGAANNVMNRLSPNNPSRSSILSQRNFTA